MSDPARRPIERPFEAYNGDKPFVFVSYSHDDMAEVYADIAHLHNEGYRIWYDEGVPPGEIFAERIARKIRNCSHFIVFLSRNAVRSQWVLNEINFALEAKKQFLAVHLTERDEKDMVFWDPLMFTIGPRDALYKYHWSPADYLKRLASFLPESLQESPYEAGSPEEDFAREVKLRVQEGHGWSESLEQELHEFAELLGLSKERAEQVIEETLARMGVSKASGPVVETFSKLVAYYLKLGEIKPERRLTLANRANELGISSAQWETLVQTMAAAKARELIQSGESERAKRLLISCVGEVVPQTDEVRLLLEELAPRRAVVEEPPPRVAVTPAPTPSPTAEAVPVPTVEPRSEPVANRAVTMMAPDVAITWLRVPGGLFLRGCPEEFIRHVERKFGADADELRKFPVRKESLEQFWISLTSITNAQYYAFVRATGHRYPAGWRGTTPPYPVADANRPVTGVNFKDSVDFASWVGGRLPTRAEYEKASRGEEGLLFPWGNEFDPIKCNTAESKRGELTLVDAFPAGASPYGALDLVGNVWEWVDGKRGELTMTVGASYEYIGEVYGATFFDLSRPAESSEKDLGFRIACSDIHQLLLRTEEIPDARPAR